MLNSESINVTMTLNNLNVSKLFCFECNSSVGSYLGPFHVFAQIETCVSCEFYF